MTRWRGVALGHIVRGAFRGVAPKRFAAAAGLVIALAAPMAHGQPAGILGDGNAVASGFSGALPPVQIAPGSDPADKTLIDGDGAVLRVIDIQAPGAPPAGQLVMAPKPFTVRASQIGQVFGVAIDGANPPNIYAAATSLYGLPIVGADIGSDGQPVRLKQGAPKAAFMPGLFGPGGPGSIWRIDGRSGAVTLFATVALDGVANPGPALGGLAFDPVSSTLLIADRATGMIHRFDLNGSERNRFDHGTQGRNAAGLPALAHQPAQQLDITSPAFMPADPATWRLAPPARRIFALTVQQGRLYYSVAEERQVWSVAMAPDGTFGADARLELSVPAGPAQSEITKIVFDDRGRMLLAERTSPSGAYDFAALTAGGGGRVLRFEPSAAAAGQRWQPASGDPQIGLDPDRRGNGGLAIGYGYDDAGRRNPASCFGSLWWTGEQLSPGGANAVNGLSGRPEGAASAWLIDFDDQLDDPQSRGHMGDVVIFRACAPVVAGGAPPGGPPPGLEAPPPIEPPFVTEAMPPEGGFGPEDGFIPILDWPPPPPPICPVGSHLEQGALACCPLGMIPGETGACRSHCANGSMNAAENFACDRGFQPNHQPGGPDVGTCWNGLPAQHLFAGPNNFVTNKCPKPPIGECQAGFQLVQASAANPVQPGWLWSDATCVLAPAQLGCVGNQQVGLDGVCHNICPPGQRAFPVNRCCANGTHPDALGQCGPGIIVPPLWYLDYLVTGSGPCIPPNCSFYEFTVTAKQRFGSGTLTQRITLPPGSAFSTARIVRGSRYCSTKAWSCSKSGDVVTCSAEHCGLGDGDQVVIRLEGSVAPGLTTPPPTPIEKTACGVLEWQATAGPGAAVIEQQRQGAAAPTPQPAQQGTAAGVSTTSKQACWTIRIVGQPTACPPNYSATPDGQCCLDRQLTATGQCCPAGMRPDAERKACVPVTPPPAACAPAQMLSNGQCCPSGTTPNNRRMTCDPVTPPSAECVRSQMTTSGQCCPDGTRPDESRKTCVPIVPPCEPAQRLKNGQCCPSGTWPNNRRMTCDPLTPPPARTCGPDETGVWPNCCPQGRYWNGRKCVPVSTRTCPPDSIGTPPDCRCRPPLVGKPGSCIRPVVVCPRGMTGTPPDCHPVQPLRCPRGMTGTPPDCRPIRPLRCPRGMIGSPPDCRPMPHATPMPRNQPVTRPDHPAGAPVRRGIPGPQ